MNTKDKREVRKREDKERAMEGSTYVFGEWER